MEKAVHWLSGQWRRHKQNLLHNTPANFRLQTDFSHRLSTGWLRAMACGEPLRDVLEAAKDLVQGHKIENEVINLVRGAQERLHEGNQQLVLALSKLFDVNLLTGDMAACLKDSLILRIVAELGHNAPKEVVRSHLCTTWRMSQGLMSHLMNSWRHMLGPAIIPNDDAKDPQIHPDPEPPRDVLEAAKDLAKGNVIENEVINLVRDAQEQLREGNHQLVLALSKLFDVNLLTGNMAACLKDSLLLRIVAEMGYNAPKEVIKSHLRTERGMNVRLVSQLMNSWRHVLGPSIIPKDIADPMNILSSIPSPDIVPKITIGRPQTTWSSASAHEFRPLVLVQFPCDGLPNEQNALFEPSVWGNVPR
jgi:hypothetical protein